MRDDHHGMIDAVMAHASSWLNSVTLFFYRDRTLFDDNITVLILYSYGTEELLAIT